MQNPDLFFGESKIPPPSRHAAAQARRGVWRAWILVEAQVALQLIGTEQRSAAARHGGIGWEPVASLQPEE